MQPSYWAQLPGNFKYITRPATLSTLNLASFASLHNYPTGKKEGNHWGQAVTIMDTSSGTPYFFNFHLKDVGHTVIIGPTGAGKTVLMNFLLAQAQKFNAKLFQLMPKPLLTLDQLRLLKYDNIVSNKYKTNFDLKMYANKKFDEEINRYSFNWTSGGQFAKKNIKLN